MLNQRLLAQARPSRPRAYIPALGAISLLFVLAGALLYLSACYAPAFIAAYNEAGLRLHIAGVERTYSGAEAVKTFLSVGVMLFGALIGLFNLGKMSGRKGCYGWLWICPILALLSLILGAIFYFLLRAPIWSGFTLPGEQIYFISAAALAGCLLCIDVLSFFDPLIYDSRFAPIYRQRKRALAALPREEEGPWKKEFAACWKKRRYSRMLEMLFFFELDVEATEPLSEDAYDYLKQKGFEVLQRQKAREWDALFAAHQHVPFKREISLLLRSEEQLAKALPPLPEDKFYELAIKGEEGERGAIPELSRRQKRAIAKAEKAEARRARKAAKQRQE